MKTFLKQDSKQASVHNVTDVLPPNICFKRPENIANSPKKPDYFEKDCSSSTSSSLSQRTRPLILKKLTPSSKTSIIRPFDVSDFLTDFSNSSVHYKTDLDDISTNTESGSKRIDLFKNISAINNKEPEAVDVDSPGLLNSEKKTDDISTAINHHHNENSNISSGNENISEITNAVSSGVDLTLSENDQQFDILSTAINNSDILFSDVSCMGKILNYSILINVFYMF